MSEPTTIQRIEMLVKGNVYKVLLVDNKEGALDRENLEVICKKHDTTFWVHDEDREVSFMTKDMGYDFRHLTQDLEAL